MAPPAANDPPPPLPPTVEDAYRRKCLALRTRTRAVEEANLAAMTRNMRMRRGIEKLRLERVFLLEQIQRRIKPDEMSEGSPSPPPTPKQQKPLRVKRGKRPTDSGLQYETSMAMSQDDDTVGNSFNDSMAADPHEALLNREHGIPTKQPKSAFDIFARSARSLLLVRHRKEIKDGTFDINREIEKQWIDMPEDMKVSYRKEFKAGNYNVKLDEGQRRYIEGSDPAADVEMEDKSSDERRS